MYITMPRPTIKCSKCGSTDVAIPERSANGYDPETSPLLRCRNCGHEKLPPSHKERFDDLLKRGIGAGTSDRRDDVETF